MSAEMRRSVWPAAAVLLLLYLAYDVSSQQSVLSGGTTFVHGLRVEYVPNPNDIVNIAEGSPYSVPPGKILVITDYSVSGVQQVQGSQGTLLLRPTIQVDGSDTWATGYCAAFSNNTASYGDNTGSAGLSHAFRTGLKVLQGQTVTLHSMPTSNGQAAWSTNPRMFASGYLAKAE